MCRTTFTWWDKAWTDPKKYLKQYRASVLYDQHAQRTAQRVFDIWRDRGFDIFFPVFVIFELPAEHVDHLVSILTDYMIQSTEDLTQEAYQNLEYVFHDIATEAQVDQLHETLCALDEEYDNNYKPYKNIEDKPSKLPKQPKYLNHRCVRRKNKFQRFHYSFFP